MKSTIILFDNIASYWRKEPQGLRSRIRLSGFLVGGWLLFYSYGKG